MTTTQTAGASPGQVFLDRPARDSRAFSAESAAAVPLPRLLVPTLAAIGLLVAAVLLRDAVTASLSTLSDVRWRWVPLLLLAQFVSMAAPAVNTVLLLRSTGHASGCRPSWR